MAKVSTCGKISAFGAGVYFILIGIFLWNYFHWDHHVSSEGGVAVPMIAFSLILQFGGTALIGSIFGVGAIFSDGDRSLLTISAVTVHLLVILAIILIVLYFVIRIAVL
jgi:hypothetical protein